MPIFLNLEKRLRFRVYVPELSDMFVNCHMMQYSGNAGKELEDPRVLTDVGDVPVQELRDCGVNDDKLMNIISESVKLVMEEVGHTLLLTIHMLLLYYTSVSSSPK